MQAILPLSTVLIRWTCMRSPVMWLNTYVNKTFFENGKNRIIVLIFLFWIISNKNGSIILKINDFWNCVIVTWRVTLNEIYYLEIQINVTPSKGIYLYYLLAMTQNFMKISPYNTSLRTNNFIFNQKRLDQNSSVKKYFHISIEFNFVKLREHLIRQSS